MRHVRPASRAGYVLVAALLTALTVATGTPVRAEEPRTTVDVLRVVEGEYVVETVQVPASDAEATADELEADPDVVVASPSVTWELIGSTPDPLWNVSEPVEMSRARTAWLRTRGEGQTVAVLDSAAAISHPDMAGAVLDGIDIVGGSGDPWHGYGVAGVIAARADNGMGSAGVAPGARVLPVRVCNATGCPSADIARGILWAADHGADVINMSLGGVGYSAVSAAAIQYALSKNISVVASSGNSGYEGNPVMYPAANSGVIAVSATGLSGEPALWAVRGWQVDMATVGDTVAMPYPDGGYVSASGTSFSGPAVAGAVALLRAGRPGIGVEEIQSALQASAESSAWDRAWGAGRLDAAAALDAADRPDGGITVTPGAQSATVSWAAAAGAGSYTVRVDGVVKATVTGTTTTVTGLADGRQIAVDVQPDNGVRSRAVLATVGPAPPGVPVLHSASLSGTSTSATLSVSASVSGNSGTQISIVRDGISLGAISATLTGSPRTLNIAIGAMPAYETRWQLQLVDAYARTSAPSNAVATGSVQPAPPGAVTGLVGRVDGDEVALTWDDFGPAYTYRVSVEGSVVATPRTAGAAVPGPAVGSSRTYSVVAVDAHGQTGPATGVDVARIAPPVMTVAPQVSGTVEVGSTVHTPDAFTGADSVTHSWRACGSTGCVLVPGDVTHLITAGEGGKRLEVEAVARNSGGVTSAISALSVPVYAPPTAPGAPYMGTPVAGDASATVRWSPPASDGGSPITGYTIRTYRNSTLMGTTSAAAGATSVVVTGLTNGTTYTFIAFATNSVGTSSGSAGSAPVIPYTRPDAPGIGTPTPGDASATARWTSPPSDGGSAVSGYTVRTYRGSTLVRTDPAPGGTYSLVVPGLLNGVAHTFTVTATNFAGEGPASAASAAVTPRTVPGAPVIGTPEASDASVTVHWSAPASDGGSAVTGYTVRTFSGTTSVGTTAAAAGATSAVVPGLTNGTTYTFTVAATNAAGTGPASAAGTATPRTRPDAPVIGTASARDGSATVRWSAPNDGGSPVTGYTVHAYRGSTAVGTTSAAAGATSVIVPGLDNGTAYTFAVTATNAAGTGPDSARSAAVTPREVGMAERATDLAITHRLGVDSVNVWRMPVSGLDAGYGAPVLVKSLDFGGFSYSRSRTIAGNLGDVTPGDDDTPDHVIWHAQPNGGVLLWAVGGGADSSPRLWQDLRTGGWSWADSLPMLGDVTGDGFDDLVVRHANGPSATNIWVFPSDGRTLGAPQLWGTTSSLAQRSVLADVDSDGREDLLVVRAVSGGSGLTYEVLGANASGTGFGGFRETVFTGSPAAGWSEGASRTLAGDVTGDGRPDLITVHAQGANPGLLVWVHRNCGTGTGAACFEAPAIWQDLRTGGWSYAGSRQHLADTDGDGTEDLVSLHSQGGNPGLLVWRHRSNSTALTTPEIVADLRAGGWSYAASRATVG